MQTTLERARNVLAAIDPATLPTGERIAWAAAVAALHTAAVARGWRPRADAR